MHIHSNINFNNSNFNNSFNSNFNSSYSSTILPHQSSHPHPSLHPHRPLPLSSTCPELVTPLQDWMDNMPGWVDSLSLLFYMVQNRPNWLVSRLSRVDSLFHIFPLQLHWLEPTGLDMVVDIHVFLVHIPYHIQQQMDWVDSFFQFRLQWVVVHPQHQWQWMVLGFPTVCRVLDRSVDREILLQWVHFLAWCRTVDKTLMLDILCWTAWVGTVFHRQGKQVHHQQQGVHFPVLGAPPLSAVPVTIFPFHFLDRLSPFLNRPSLVVCPQICICLSQRGGGRNRNNCSAGGGRKRWGGLESGSFRGGGRTWGSRWLRGGGRHPFGPPLPPFG